ncbi:MAG: hypothetical protein N3D84_03965, partial [Candidatus Woesearchaeota archaeon]|nr:hypothetical protein [Candidatus Woesearchaeota archaeon]
MGKPRINEKEHIAMELEHFGAEHFYIPEESKGIPPCLNEEHIKEDCLLKNKIMLAEEAGIIFGLNKRQYKNVLNEIIGLDYKGLEALSNFLSYFWTKEDPLGYIVLEDNVMKQTYFVDYNIFIYLQKNKNINERNQTLDVILAIRD